MTFNFDTVATLSEDAGLDDPLTFILEKVYDNRDRVITSNLPVTAFALRY